MANDNVIGSRNWTMMPDNTSRRINNKLAVYKTGSPWHFVLNQVIPVLTILSLSCFSYAQQLGGTDASALLAFKAFADLHGVLNSSWDGISNPCGNTSAGIPVWRGIACNNRSRVQYIILHDFQLVGTVRENTLSRMQELRSLTLANNFFTGSLPNDLSNLTLGEIWVQNASFSGPFPTFLTSAKQLVTMNLENNNFSGPVPDLSNLNAIIKLILSANSWTGKIPPLPANLQSLYLNSNQFTGEIPRLPESLQFLDLSNNQLTGEIPPLPASLQFLNLSNNQLTGPIPSSLQHFPPSSFSGNPSLCGYPSIIPCSATPPSSEDANSPKGGPGSLNDHKLKHHPKFSTKSIVIIVVADSLVVITVSLVFVIYYLRRRRSGEFVNEKKKVEDPGKQSNNNDAGLLAPFSAATPEHERSSLVFFEASEHIFELEDLLRASAEMLGKGSFGTAYKAVMDNGIVVAVKRLRDVKDMAKKEFQQHMDLLGKLKHPNVVPMKAFYYSKEENLLVYDFVPKGNLFTLLHGNRGSGRKILDWNSRMRVAEGVAAGLAYLHHECESQNMPHGNLKLSNVLIGENFEVYIADFGLFPLITPASAAQRFAGYRAPEYIQTKRITQKADVFSYGVILLELLTGRQAAQSNQGDGIDLPRWVQSVVREEWTGEVFDLELKSYRHGDEEMVNLLRIAMACVASNPEKRPQMTQVLKLIEDIHLEESFIDSESFEFHSEDRDPDSQEASFDL